MDGPAMTEPGGTPPLASGTAYLVSLLGLVGRLTGSSRSALIREREGIVSVWLAADADGAPVLSSTFRLPKDLPARLGEERPPSPDGGILFCPIPGAAYGHSRMGIFLEKDRGKFATRDVEVASLFARSFAVALTEAPAGTSAESPARSFSEELTHEIVLARSTETPLSLVMICIRNFDELVAGQDVASVNSALTSQIRKVLRSFDRLEEWGPGKYLISVPHTPTLGAEPVARKAEEALRSTPGSVAPTPSMGIVGYPVDGREPEILLRRMEEIWVRLRTRQTSDILRAVESPPPAEVGIFSGDARTDSRNVQMLLETISAVTSPGDMETLYERVLDQIIEMTGAERGILMLKGEDDSLVQAAARLAGKKPLTEEVLLSTSTIERVMKTGDAVFVPDVLSEKDRRLISDSVQELNLRFIICAPLEVKDKRFGIVYLDSQIENQTFYRTNLTFFEAIVKQVSIAIENARLVEEKRLSDEQRRIALEEENIRLRQRLEGSLSIVGECPQMKEVFKTLEKTAVTDVTVLIYGESGTGKEAIASSIHQLSVRKARPFQIIDCGSIPENLLESELFGYRKGAFTGAYESRKGKFELANGGTIFLDEISNLPVALQMKLLRVLQERDIEPVGGGVRKKVDVRIIAATNQRLEELVERGSFRSDLYYRLNVLTIDLPPLRDRGDDILLLAKYFLSRFAREQGKEISGFSEAAKRALLNHRWPGNVREVEHRVQRAVIMTDDPSITPQDLELDGTRTQARTLKEVREEAEMRHIWEVLDRTGGNVSEASRELGVSRGTLYDLLKKLKMRVPSEN